MPHSWTKEQTLAIETTDKTLLVSAAAGSGKTATLTERIIRSLTREENPADISRMLVVTFTRAAAAELRSRISSSLCEAAAKDQKNKRISSQLLLLPSAKICTIDSFCAELVRDNATSVGLSPSFRICDENERALLCSDIMENLIEQCYGGGDSLPVTSDSFCRFADNIVSAKGGEQLGEVLLSLYESTVSFPERTGVLFKFCDSLASDGDFLSTNVGKKIKKEIHDAFSHFEGLYSHFIEKIYADGDQRVIEKHVPAFEADLEFIRTFLRTKADTYAELLSAFCAYEKKSLLSVRGDPPPQSDIDMRRVRSLFSELYKKLSLKYFSYSPEKIDALVHRMHEFSHTLACVEAEFDRRFCREKARRGICDYGDLEHYALQLLYDGERPSAFAESVKCRFDFVYIDEYQDVNPVQHAIFSAIAREDNCFMVGDIKQSIYSFRRADPDIFASMKRAFPPVSEGGKRCSLFMSDNFRCDREVVDFVNAVFDTVFGVAGESIGYTHGDRLTFSKAVPAGAVGVPTELYLLEKPLSSRSYSDDEDEDTDECEDAGVFSEPEAVARRIKELLDGERLASGEKIKPSDIAILLRGAKNKAALYAQALHNYGIPCVNGEGQSFFSHPEILLVLCLLNAIDNPRRDVYLAGALHSPIYGVTLDELVAIRSSVKGKTSLFDALTQYCEQNPSFERGAYFLSQLRRFRRKARGCPVDRLIEYVYDETNLLSMYGKDSEAGHNRLIYLYNHARRFEASSFRGLYNFVEYINEIIEHKRTFDEPSGEQGEGVSIMTVHHSKGLEFPVCFVCDCGANVTSQDAKKDLLFSSRLGVGVRLLEGEGTVKAENPIRHALAADVREHSLREELRVLYVALTRARERLIVTGRAQKNALDFLSDCEILSQKPSEYGFLNMRSYMQIMLCALAGQGGVVSARYVDLSGKVYELDGLSSEALIRAQMSQKPSEDEKAVPPQAQPQADTQDGVKASGKSDEGNEQAKYEIDGQTNKQAEEQGNEQNGTKEEMLSPDSEPLCEEEKQFVCTLKERFDFCYPHKMLTQTPQKLSVSRLYPDVLDELSLGEGAQELNASGEEEGASQFPLDAQDVTDAKFGYKHVTPRFAAAAGEESDAAERGIATHLFMQFASFERVRASGAEKELERLVAQGFITEKDAKNVYLNELAAFEKSELLCKLLCAKNLWREFRFNVLLDASEFSSDEQYKKALAGERLLVQGVVDCIIENDDGTIDVVDYKTDRMTREEKSDHSLAKAKLSRRHSQQLEYYSLACERIYGKKPSRLYIYSTPLGELFEL